MEEVGDEVENGEVGVVSAEDGGEVDVGDVGGVVLGSRGVGEGDGNDESGKVAEDCFRKVSVVGTEDVEVVEGNIDSINSTWRE